MILALVNGQLPLLARGLEARWLVYLGKISYGLYLWHHTLAWIPIKWRDTTPIATAVVIVIEVLVALGLATISYLLVERRFLRRKSRYC